MPGLYCIYDKKNELQQVYKEFYNLPGVETIEEEIKEGNFIFGRNVLNKLLNDRIFAENSEIIVCFEGVYFNKQDKNVKDTIFRLYKEKGISFIKDIDGLFSGLIYDKRLREVYLFNDHLSTKPLYYYINPEKELFVCASQLKAVINILKKLFVNVSISEDSVKSIIFNKYLDSDKTPTNEIKKLEHSTILKFSYEQFKLDQINYFKYEKDINYNLGEKDAIETIDRLLTNAVQNNWEKDQEYNAQKHIIAMSGGFDSRVNFVLAKKMFCDNITLASVGYNHKENFDVKIAKKIAAEYGSDFLFIDLDRGQYLINNFENTLIFTDGQITPHRTCQNFNLLRVCQPYNFIHSGQIGDALFGSYLNKEIPKAFRKNYSDSEIFCFDCVIVNKTVNGDRLMAYAADMLSPFYNKELINFCLTLPPEYKQDKYIYRQWMKNKHPELLKYATPKTYFKPVSDFHIKMGEKYLKIRKHIYKKFNLTDNFQYTNFNLWLEQSPELKDFYYREMKKEIDIIENTNIRNFLAEINRLRGIPGLHNEFDKNGAIKTVISWYKYLNPVAY